MLFLSEKFKSFFVKLSFRRLVSGFFAFNLRDKLLFLFLVIAGLFGMGLFLMRFYFSNTILVPSAGGVYTEGVVGFPRYLNPAIPDQNNTEEMIENLIFSRLYKPDGRGGLEPDLADSITVFEDGKVFLVSLKKDVLWHDNERLTARDVAFSLELLKNQELQNSLADFWKEVDVEILSDQSLKFTLKKSYRFFPYYLSFLVMPEHIWKDIQVSSFVFSKYNLEPIGSGPYKFKKIIQDKDGKIVWYGLTAFDKYYSEGPYLESFNFEFFEKEELALAALRKKEIQAFNSNSSKESLNYAVKEIPETQVFSLLFNNSNELLKDYSLRKAIALAVDKEKILKESFHNGGSLTNSAIPLKEFSAKFESIFDLEKSKQILLDAGWQDKDGDGFLEKRLSAKTKTVTRLELSVLFRDVPEISDAAEKIKVDLAKIGISLVLKPMGVNEFSSRLQTRSYQMVLLGLSSFAGKEPDLFPFWHSSQSVSPGLNFAVYKNKEVDRLLSFMKEGGDDDLGESYQELDAIISNDLPGVFLFQPKVYWFVDESFHFPEISFISGDGERFVSANKWYLYQKRVWSR